MAVVEAMSSAVRRGLPPALQEVPTWAVVAPLWVAALLWQGWSAILHALLLGTLPGIWMLCLTVDLVGPAVGLYSRRALDEAAAAAERKGALRRSSSEMGDEASPPEGEDPLPGGDETLRALNFAGEQVWPFLTKFVEDKVQELVRSALAVTNSCIPASIGKIGLQSCKIGEKHPILGPFKVRRSHGHCGGATLPGLGVEIQVGFAYDSNLEAMLSTPLARFGLARLAVNGELSLYLRPFLPEPPFIGGLEVAFANSPRLDVEFKGLASLANVPELKELLFSALDEELAKALVMPNRQCILLTQDPRVDAVLQRCPAPIGVLRVRILEASSLIAGDIRLRGHSSDAYVKVKLGARTWRTPTVWRSLDPKWREDNVEDFLVYSEDQLVHMDVWDDDSDKHQADDHLGGITPFPISKIVRRRSAGGGGALTSESLNLPTWKQQWRGRRSQLLFQAVWLHLAPSLKGGPEMGEGPNRYMLELRLDGEQHGEPGGQEEEARGSVEEATPAAERKGALRRSGAAAVLEEEKVPQFLQEARVKLVDSKNCTVTIAAAVLKPVLVALYDSETELQLLRPLEVGRLMLPSMRGSLELDLLLATEAGSAACGRSSSRLRMDLDAMRAVQEAASRGGDNFSAPLAEVPCELLAAGLPLTIVGAKHLRSADLNGSSDPFCICRVEGRVGDVTQTAVIQKTLEPTWDHSAEVPNFSPYDRLTFLVYDKDLIGKDLLGQATLNGADFWAKGFDGALQLDDSGVEKKASLHVRIQPVAGVRMLRGSFKLSRLER